MPLHPGLEHCSIFKVIPMKKMLALLIGAVCTLAMANTEFKNIPVPMQKALRGNALKTVHLDNGVMRLQMVAM